MKFNLFAAWIASCGILLSSESVAAQENVHASHAHPIFAGPIVISALDPTLAKSPAATGDPQTTQSQPAQTSPQVDPQQAQQPIQPYTPPVSPIRALGGLGSTYIPLDSWMYPELLRLYSLGYLDTTFLGLRPWTRKSVAHMLEQTAGQLTDAPENDEALEIYLAVERELARDQEGPGARKSGTVELDSVYTRMMGISGLPLRDSFHLGQTIVNDYGRPYQEGFNNSTGVSARTEVGRFSFYARGEYQYSPSAAGLSDSLVQTLAAVDSIAYVRNPALFALGPLPAQNNFRLMEGYISAHAAGHEISFGKSDAWLGPAFGGGMAWSNNAENLYSFRINRIEPLKIPLLWHVLGPLRYDFFVGSLKGHTYPNSPWAHAEKFSFKPTSNFEFGFERTVIWGGKGHAPITIHTFLKSFLSISDTTTAVKYSREDPGARFSAFDFSYRLPFVRKYFTFYADSETHDDVTPISAPRRAAIRTGLYLSQFPGLRKLDLRAEGAFTDPAVKPSFHGQNEYFETIQRNGYTNKGFITGDWLGRESKGGQAWLTYHLSGNEWLQVSYRNAKAAKDFIPGGTTQNLFTASAVKRIGKDIEVNAWVQYERWKIPIYKPGARSDTTATAQITWYPRKLRSY